MALTQLAILYAVIGVGCAIAILARAPRRIGDAMMLVGLWPILAPFMLVVPPRRPPLAAGGLSELLPTGSLVERLRARLHAARKRVSEIDELLAEPDLGLAAVESRIEELSRGGASARALSSAESRRKSIIGLMRRRKRLAGELDELAELFLQLKTQSEVVRLAGSPQDNDSVGDLVTDIQARLEGLDELLQEEM